MKSLFLLIFLVLVAILGQFEIPTKEPPSDTDKTTVYAVSAVIDGDTFQIQTPSGIRTVRLIGIDTPETDPNRGGIECFGNEATHFAKRLLEDETLRLEYDESQGDTDIYDRLLRHAFLPDGTNVGERLIKEGFAKEYTFNQPYAYQKLFKEAEKTAQTNQRGVWSCAN